MLFIVRRATNPVAPRRQLFIVNAAIVMTLVFAAAAASVAIFGPWRLLSNPIRISAGSATRPVVLALFSGAISVSTWWPWRRKPRDLSTLAFYVFAAIACWLFALGPEITHQGQTISTFGPFRAFMWLPGVTGLRVPARFWGLGTMCLGVIAGLVIAEFQPRPAWGALVMALLTVGILSDGWVNVLEYGSTPDVPSVEVARLHDHVVMTLPEGDARDLQNTYAAVIAAGAASTGTADTTRHSTHRGTMPYASSSTQRSHRFVNVRTFTSLSIERRRASCSWLNVRQVSFPSPPYHESRFTCCHGCHRHRRPHSDRRREYCRQRRRVHRAR